MVRAGVQLLMRENPRQRILPRLVLPRMPGVSGVVRALRFPFASRQEELRVGTNQITKSKTDSLQLYWSPSRNVY
jgi:hypothetical protein